LKQNHNFQLVVKTSEYERFIPFQVFKKFPKTFDSYLRERNVLGGRDSVKNKVGFHNLELHENRVQMISENSNRITTFLNKI